MQLFQKQAKPVKPLKTLWGGKSLIFKSLGMGLLTVSLSAQPQGAFWSPSSSILGSPNTNSAIGIMPPIDWRFTIESRNFSGQAATQGINLLTHRVTNSPGGAIIHPTPDVLRVLNFDYATSISQYVGTPQEIFKISGNGSVVTQGNMDINSNISRLRITATTNHYAQFNANSIQWRKASDNTIGQLFFGANNFLGLNTSTPEAALHIKTINVSNSGDNGQVHGLLIENNGWRDHDYAMEIKSAHGRIFTVSNGATVHIGEGLNFETPVYQNNARFRLYVQDGIRTERVRVI